MVRAEMRIDQGIGAMKRLYQAGWLAGSARRRTFGHQPRDRGRESHTMRRRQPTTVISAMLAVLCMPYPALAKSTTDDFIAVQVIGDAAEFPQELDEEFLAIFEDQSLQAFANGFQSKGTNINPGSIEIKTEVVSIGRRKVIGTRARASSIGYVYQYTGTVGAELISVICASADGAPFELRGSACERTAATVFAQ